MYREFYGLLQAPFEMTPDPAFLYLGETHREGLAMLVYAIQSRKGFVVLTGEVGTGKTTLLHALLSQMDSDVPSAFVFNPRLDPLDFFRVLFDEFGIEEPCFTKAEYLLALNHFLIEQLKQDRTALLIVDEAQNLAPEMLEEIRLLSNLETPTSKLLQIILVGQPELAEMLDRDDLRQLRQRIVLRHDLRPFGAEELGQYIDERLRLAGYNGKGIFDKSARKQMLAVTCGIPRLVNVVADGALLAGYSRGLKTLDAGVINEVAGDLRLPAGPAKNGVEVQSPSSEPARRPRLRGWLRQGRAR
jgi:general secretion pathway protein A